MYNYEHRVYIYITTEKKGSYCIIYFDLNYIRVEIWLMRVQDEAKKEYQKIRSCQH